LPLAFGLAGWWWDNTIMLRKFRIIIATPFMLVAVLFKLLFLRILPKDLREESSTLI